MQWKAQLKLEIVKLKSLKLSYLKITEKNNEQFNT